MTWLPIKRYELTTRLNFEQVIAKIESTAGRSLSTAEARNGVSITDDNSTDSYTVKWFSGKFFIKETTPFKFGGYSNSFKPEANITLQALPQGTKLKVVFRPPVAAMLFLFFAVCFILTGVLFAKRTDLALGRYKEVTVAVVGVLMFAYLLPVFAFNTDLSKIESFVCDLFEAEEEINN